MKTLNWVNKEIQNNVAEGMIDLMKTGWIYESIEKEEGVNCFRMMFIDADEKSVFAKPIINNNIIEEIIKCERSTWVYSIVNEKMKRVEMENFPESKIK